MNAKAKGNRREHQAVKLLEAQGYLVIRAAGSHGPFDLAAFRVDGCRLIQCKSNEPPRKTERERMLSFPKLPFATVESWVFHDYQPQPLIEILG